MAFDPPTHEWELDLSELLKSPIRVYGYASSEYGDGEDRVFKITRIVTEAGKSYFVEGEHDMPYIPATEDIVLPPEEEEEE